jgi:hypothetical protein
MRLLASVWRGEQGKQEYPMKLLRQTVEAQQQLDEQLVQMIEDTSKLLDVRA